MAYIYIDTEYTDFFSTYQNKTGELLQVGAAAVVDGVVVSTFNEYCRPLTKRWSEGAERVHKISRDRASMFQHPEACAELFIRWVESLGDHYFTLKGWNCKGDKCYIERLMFDYNFMSRFQAKTRLDWIDIFDKAKARKDYLPINSLKLERVCEYFGIKYNAHDALADILATIKVEGFLASIKLPNKYQQVSANLELTEKEKIKKYMSSEYVQVGGDGAIFIQPRATHTPEALQVIFSELYSRFVSNA